MTRVLVLVATVPSRRASCERLLAELALQSRPPDAVILCLDGYGEDSAPPCPLPLAATRRTEMPAGPGHRWKVADALLHFRPTPCFRAVYTFDPDDIFLVLDDDAVLTEAPRFVEALAVVLETTNAAAAAAMGTTPQGHRAAPGDVSRGRLVLGCGCGLAVRAGHLKGLTALAAEVRAAGGPDALGFCGDDQALVSAHLWLQAVPLLHAATGPLSFAPGTQRDSQTQARRARGEDLHDQARAIARITGWPYPEPVVEEVTQPTLSWDEEWTAVPQGAVRARGAAPPVGWRRGLVVDAEEPERSGVYDAPGPRA